MIVRSIMKCIWKIINAPNIDYRNVEKKLIQKDTFNTKIKQVIHSSIKDNLIGAKTNDNVNALTKIKIMVIPRTEICSNSSNNNNKRRIINIIYKKGHE